MNIRIMSDLHLEHNPIVKLIDLPTDQDGILVLAGDVCPYNRDQTFIPFMNMVSSMFKHVIYVAGNHEFYGRGSFLKGYDAIRKMIAEHNWTNINLLQNETVVIDDVAFVGATLWTDFHRGNPVQMVLAKQYMNDFHQTYYGDPLVFDHPDRRMLMPQDVYDAHQQSRQYVFQSAKEQKALGNKVVMVVHHGVSDLSVHSRFRGDPMNGAFVSNLENEIIDANPDILVHGHVHNNFDYMIENTRVIVNPRAYPGENGDWDECLVVEI